MKYTFVLSTIAQEHLGKIINIDDSSVSFKRNMNSANEISFDCYRILDDIEDPLWDKIISLKLVYVKEFDEYYSIDVQEVETDNNKKTVTCTSLCESELSQTILYSFNINNEEDKNWLEDDYNNLDYYRPTVFYNAEKPDQSLMDRLLDKLPHYTFDAEHSDASLFNLQRTFSLDGTNVYDFLTGDCAQQFDCLFEFDTKSRSIIAHDLYTVCKTDLGNGEICGYRSDYSEFFNQATKSCTCPKCKTTGNDLILQIYGEETTTYINTSNLTNSIDFKTETSSIKNCLRLSTGDELMDTTVVGLNPNGSRYIYYFNEETYADMPTALSTKIKQYNADMDYYKNDYIFNPTKSKLKEYNDLVNKYKAMYKSQTDDELFELPASMQGYSSLTSTLYNIIDFELYLDNVMMPGDYKIDFLGAEGEANKLYQNLDVIAVNNLSANTSSYTVENAIKMFSKVFIYTGYVRATPTTSYWNYSSSGSVWGGYITVTNYSDEEDVWYVCDKGVVKNLSIAQNNPIEYTVNGDYETFVRQKLAKKLAEDNEKDTSFQVIEMPIDNIDEIKAFRDALKLFGRTRLQAFINELDICMTNILMPLMETRIDNNMTYVDPVKEFYDEYNQKSKYINEELELRESEIKTVQDMYTMIFD